MVRLRDLRQGCKLAAPLCSLCSDRRGSSLILVGLLGVVLLGFTAIGVDGASFFLARRHQQAATDMAAIAAAAALNQASARIATVMAANGFPAAALEIATGRYTPDASLDPEHRFALSGAGNAVRVTATTTQPFIFGGAFQALLGGSQASGSAGTGFTIRTQAIARKQDSVAFTLGTGVAALDGGLLNGVLGGLLGTSISLTAMDYQGLANARVDLFEFSNAVATRIGATGSTYGSLSAGVATPSVLFASLADALAGNPAAAAAARTVAGTVPSSVAAPLAPLIDFGPAASLAVGAQPPVSARVSGLDLLTALVRLCNGGRLATLDLGTSLPGLAGVQMSVLIGEPAQGSGFFAVGPEGTILHAAQVRLQVTAQVSGAGLPGTMTVPFYLELAPATAAVASLDCANGASQAVATLSVASGLATAAIGTVRASDMANLSASPPVSAAPLLDLAGILRVTAAAQASLANPGGVAVPFTADDIRSGLQKTTSSATSLATLLNGLAQDTRVSVSLFGLTPPQPTLLTAVQAAVAASVRPLDLALERLLPVLGLSVGNATAGVTGVRCGQGQLVN